MIKHTKIPGSGRRSLRWAVGLAAAAAVTLAAPAAASAQTDDGGDYVETTVPQEPSIDVSAFSPVCIKDAPFIQYSIVPQGFTPTGGATLRVIASNGTVLDELQNQPLSGQIIWPGAAVDSEGNGIQWPGWTTADDGSYIPDPTTEFLRGPLTFEVTVNPSASTTVSYPPATSACANPSNTTTGTPGNPAASLPETGGSGINGTLGMGALMLALGGGAVFVARQRRNAEPTPA